MDRIDRLERSWIIYKTKKIARSASFFVLALIIGALVVYVALRYVNATGDTPPIAQIANAPQPIATATVAPQISAPQPTTLAAAESAQTGQEANAPKPTETQAAQSKPKMNITPNFDFASEVDRRVAASLSASRPNVPSTPIQPPVRSEPTQTVSNPVSLQRVSNVKDLISAFDRQPTYSKAVDIAESYLKQNDFQNAYSWALKANELNVNDERSWAVFALSSYKMGDKVRAVNALKGYLGVRSSERLSKLLYQIERDERGL
ncbi:MAG: hypothetical protein LBF86_01205 [Helicobacteraceae bacterium]|jgi:hypothetical protein|nr:hypothetical protein [Helicobacteraceae bacterium]